MRSPLPWRRTAAALLAAILGSCSSEPPASRPSVVLVSLDCLNQRQLEQAWTKGRAPELARLAGDSLVFTRAYAHAPWTTPSHMSMLTGLYPSQHGRGIPFQMQAKFQEGYDREPLFQTLPERLAASGFETVAFVGGGQMAPGFGLAQGFSIYHSGTRANDEKSDIPGSTPFFRDLLQAEAVVGVDASEQSLAVARERHGSSSVRFRTAREYAPERAFSLAFCNGVFHHVPPDERPGVARLIRDSLEPGGLLALWDNNPWNPGARYVMWRIPFDRHAVMLSARAARRLLEQQGLEVLRVDHLFVFPRFLRALRPLERTLASLPLGAQFQVLARRPGVA